MIELNHYVRLYIPTHTGPNNEPLDQDIIGDIRLEIARRLIDIKPEGVQLPKTTAAVGV